MICTLFNFKKRRNSTKVPSELGASFELKLKDGCSIYNPSFILSSMDPINYNYLKWNNKYYYIDDIILIRQGLWNVVCSLDVLASYRTEILNTSAFVAYSSNNYDPNIPDARLSSQAKPTITHTNNNLFNTQQALTPEQIKGGSGTYIVSYVTDAPTYGLSGCVWCSPLVAKNIAKCLGSRGLNEFLLDKLKKQLSNAYQAVLKCTYVPFKWWTTAGEVGYKPPSAGGGGGSSGGTPNPEGFTPRLTRDGMADLIFYNNPINPFFPNFAPPIVGQGNCTWYAWGRFWEICGASNPPKSLPVGHAGTWYHDASAFNRGQSPKVGAIACFGDGVGLGHVCVVEEVYENGDIMTSNSSYPDTYFFTQKLSRSNNYYFQDAGPFQGFIYNSCV